jgi:microcystin-dependent protein
MSTLQTILGTDKIKDSREVINNNFTELNNDKVETLADLDVTVSAVNINAVVERNVTLPSGMISMTARASAPDGWLLCLGQAVSRTTYATLFSAIGTTYGAGDSSTTFNLPNLQGRVPVGFDSSQTEFDALGETGGAKTHTLTINQIPSHDHGVPNGAQLWRVGTDSGAAGGGNNRAISPTFNAQGGGEAHNNLQPYLVLNYIIKI